MGDLLRGLGEFCRGLERNLTRQWKAGVTRPAARAAKLPTRLLERCSCLGVTVADSARQMIYIKSNCALLCR